MYDCEVRHTRNTTAKRAFHYSTSYWLVDVDRMPRLPRVLRPLARFRPSDHLGDPACSIADNARARLAQDGIEADRILLLTCPRTAGHVFNPLSVFYCFAGADLVAVLAEVHNTYHGRHVYLLRPDEAGRDSVEKGFYVSPFLPMGGRYLMRTPPPGDRLQVSIALRRGDTTPFVATLTGTGRPATTGAVVRSLLRWPLNTLRTSALIRWQGIRLWLRGIPVQPRPADASGDETAR
ncbi:DUF1365 family protein [Nakamurella sp. YIM 132087]|uniref:DUF1365 family protein n=1 Tax=Nakamurella alba TaxID=2665158 RepID=A0A7K1FN18_9ACTN|nr:DUF1365 family protein [Nakamurella alba]